MTFRSPAKALAAGVGMVYQRFMLVENLTVLKDTESVGRIGLLMGGTSGRKGNWSSATWGFPSGGKGDLAVRSSLPPIPRRRSSKIRSTFFPQDS